jgi:hypothetical protein
MAISEGRMSGGGRWQGPSIETAMAWGPRGALILLAGSVITWATWTSIHWSSYWFAAAEILVPLAGSLLLGLVKPPEAWQQQPFSSGRQR